MFSFLNLISILLIVTIYDVQQSHCGDDFSRLGPFGYDFVNDLLAKYARNNEADPLSDSNNQLLDQVSDQIEYKVS